MKQVTFIHTADLHLDSPFIGMNHLPDAIFQRIKESTFQSFKRTIDVAIKERVDFLLISGDVYDQKDRSLKAQLFFQKQMVRLYEKGINVYIIHGNHDYTKGNSIHLDLPENVHIFSDEDVECVCYERDGEPLASLYGYSYPERVVTENMSKRYNKTANTPFHIGLLHGSIAGEREHEPYCPFRLSDLIEKDFDYWALGHIHKRQVLHDKTPVIVYPGNIQGRHLKELGEKGIYLVELKETGANYQFIPTAPIIFREYEIKMESIRSFTQLIESIQSLKTVIQQQGIHTFCSLRLTGHTSLYDELMKDGVLDDLVEMVNEEEDGQERHFIWVLAIHNQATCDTAQYTEKFSLFTRDIEEVLEHYDVHEALQPLYKNKAARRYIESFSREEKEEIIQEAKMLIFHEWLKTNAE
ncbi:DNA repair exonuclease [Bacillus sp. FJAT-47783]|uniref:metallophosphoesterase family protein n=1 Tax=Bacillus sp. FJAT-47783 TaxID=2922712 RepID=UPI001FAD6293|nr:DNA repair exonuclease [Bacillus sp. FJAT-47783]